MGKLRFTLINFLMLSAAFNLGGVAEAAEKYPVKPIIYIVPTEAGAEADIFARPLVQKASTVLGQPIVIVNKPGAGSSIAYRELHDARPDGYTIGSGTVTIITNKIQGLLPYDHHDFTHMGTFYRMFFSVFASTKTSQPFKNIEEIVSYARSNPGKLSIATGSIGSGIWIAAMNFMTGMDIKLNIIPQAGTSALTVAQVAGGHADLTVNALPSAKAQLDAGNLRFLAVVGPKRFPGYEQIPTLKELGYDFEPWESFGLVMGPPKMPKDVTDKLTKAFEVAANDPEYQKFLQQRLITPFYLPPNQVITHSDQRGKLARNTMDKAGILKEK